MENADVVESTRSWVREKKLGSGTFGLVVLWKNAETGKMVALKHYKGPMEAKNRERWIKEVNILKSLKHSNIVRAFDVPNELKDDSSELPVLAMEYCDGGDLRRVLGKAHNSYGFKQKDLFSIMDQIADGIHYLHEREIIHRDIKPENIVLKPMPENQTIYKIIDLGYAKDIGHGSVPQSFAGTPQYAAPDLLKKKPYDKAVDYWSLAILCFEMIVGRRPFSPVDNDPVIHWYQSITGKPERCICMMETIDGDVSFSINLPQYNNLSRNALKLFEIWLQSMLSLDPTKRGKVGATDGKLAPWYMLLKEILQTKEFTVLDMTKNRLLVYHSKEIKTVTDIHNNLAKDTNIPIQEQELLLPGGKIAMQTDIPTSRSQDNANYDLPDYFLFRKSGHNEPYDIELSVSQLPPWAKMLSEKPLTVVTQMRVRLRMWSQCLYACNIMLKEAVHITEGIRAAKMNFMRKLKDLTSTREKITNLYHKLLGKHEFFKASASWDLTSYKSQKDCGINSEGMLNNWSESEFQFATFPSELEQQFEELKTRTDSLANLMVEIREFPLRTQSQEALDDSYNNAQQLYYRLKKEMRELMQKKPKDVDCSDLIGCMMLCQRHRVALGRDAAEQVLKLLTCRDSAIKIRDEMEDAMAAMIHHEMGMMTAQKKRQQDIWVAINYCMDAVNKCKNKMEAAQQQERDSMGPSTLQANTMTPPGTLRGSSTLFPPSTVGPYSREFQSPESLKAVEDSLTTRQLFEEVVDRCCYESSTRLEGLQNLTWDFQ